MASNTDAIPPEPPDEPIAILRDLEIVPQSDLPARVRRTIERRFLGRDLLAFYWKTTAELVMEWLSAAFGRTGGAPSEKGERN